MMKKNALSLFGLLTVAAFAPDASALPVFARQTGMACSACHFQHYPLMNSYGRSFKASGFTMIGAQAKVEDSGLSIPITVNAAFLTSMGYEKTSATQADGTAKLSSAGAPTGSFYVAGTEGEASLFVGGRGSENMGFLAEITLPHGATLDSLKTPILFDVANGARAGIVPFTTNAQGASYGYEVLNTGANAVHSMTNTVGHVGQYINAVSAQQYINTAGTATGMAIVANSSKGFINLTKYDLGGIDHGDYAGMSSTYARAVAIFDLGSWDSAVGIQSWSGSSTNNPVANAPAALPPVIGTLMNTQASAIDGQMQGAIRGLPVGFYASAARAPASGPATTTFLGNMYNQDVLGNQGTLTRSSFNIDAEVGVIPGKATLGMAMRRANSGQDTGTVNGLAATTSNTTDNALYLTATYKLTQNMLGRLSYVHQTGSYWTAITNAALGSNSATVNLYALF